MLTIAAVAKQTGIQAATLRKWEVRYGFPVPGRTAGDHRVFDARDLDGLFEISRRIAAGERVGAAISAFKLGMSAAVPEASAKTVRLADHVSLPLNWLQRNDLQSLEVWMTDQLAEHGPAIFSREIAVPMIEAVGSMWQQGRLPIYSEHLFSSTLQRVLQLTSARRAVPKALGSHVLLASPAGEQHGLALLLLQAVLNEAAISNVLLVGGLPSSEIAAAAKALGVQIVAISASGACQPKGLVAELRSLRALLPEPMELWVGGGATRRISWRTDGIAVVTSIDSAVQTLISRGPMSSCIVGTINDKSPASSTT